MTRTDSSQSGTASSRRRHRAGVRTSLEPDAIAEVLLENLHCLQAKRPEYATRNDWYMALAYTVRDRALDRYITALEPLAHADHPAKIIAYLSAEFLTGPHLGNNLLNLGIWDAAERAMSK